MKIVDRRASSRSVGIANRKKFIDRNKASIKEQIEDAMAKRKFKNIKDKKKVKLNSKDTSEPIPYQDPSTKDRDIILSGNTDYDIGDRIFNSSGSGRGRDKSKDVEDEEDSFKFHLDYDEFMDIYFSDLELPDYIKESLKSDVKWVMQRKGYSKSGVPAKIDLRKTVEMALMRRIAAKSANKKPPFFDEIDLRYKFYDKEPKPIQQAVMFLVMDVSGSMTEEHKRLAKKFYVLLYLFLTKNYKSIELVFITYTETPIEVTETEFFEGQRSGGTLVHPAVQLVDEIITKRYPVNDYNIYLAHCSDGDDGWDNDAEKMGKILTTSLLDKLQYYAYTHIDTYKERATDLLNVFYTLMKKYEKVGVAKVSEASDIYPALRRLFEKNK